MSQEKSQSAVAVNAWNKLQKVHQLIYRVLQKCFYNKGITPAQFDVLIELKKHKELPMWKISELLAVTGGNVTGLIDRMESKGLVSRERSEKDRRIINARITSKGEKMYRKVAGEFEKHLFDTLSGLENSELDQFEGMLGKLYNDLQEKGIENEEFDSDKIKSIV